MTITYETERVGSLHRGIAIDMDTFDVVLRTTTYADAETAKSAAVSQWRAKQAMDQRECVA